jgi:hypothetical protein
MADSIPSRSAPEIAEKPAWISTKRAWHPSQRAITFSKAALSAAVNSPWA